MGYLSQSSKAEIHRRQLRKCSGLRTCTQTHTHTGTDPRGLSPKDLSSLAKLRCTEALLDSAYSPRLPEPLGPAPFSVPARVPRPRAPSGARTLTARQVQDRGEQQAGSAAEAWSSSHGAQELAALAEAAAAAAAIAVAAVGPLAMGSEELVTRATGLGGDEQRGEPRGHPHATVAGPPGYP